MKSKKHHHLGFNRLEIKIEKAEHKAHPNYSEKRVHYIAQAAAGQIARKRKAEHKYG